MKKLMKYTTIVLGLTLFCQPSKSAEISPIVITPENAMALKENLKDFCVRRFEEKPMLQELAGYLDLDFDDYTSEIIKIYIGTHYNPYQFLSMLICDSFLSLQENGVFKEEKQKADLLDDIIYTYWLKTDPAQRANFQNHRRHLHDLHDDLGRYILKLNEIAQNYPQHIE